MGWGSAVGIFDSFVGPLLGDEPLDKKALIKNLIEVLEDDDWDTQADSSYYHHPLVQEAFKELHPDWFEDDGNEE